MEIIHQVTQVSKNDLENRNRIRNKSFGIQYQSIRIRNAAQSQPIKTWREITQSRPESDFNHKVLPLEFTVSDSIDRLHFTTL
jgi:hypothetical protein